jgi:hypothetical protein
MRAEATVRKGSNLPFRGKGGKVRNRRVSPVAPRPGEGPLTEPTAGAQPWPRERVLMPHFRHWPMPAGPFRRVETGPQAAAVLRCLWPSQVIQHQGFLAPDRPLTEPYGWTVTDNLNEFRN